MYKKLSVFSLLLLFSIEANAFGVVAAPAVGYAYAIVLALFGAAKATSKISRKENAIIIVALVAAIIYLGLKNYLSDQYIYSALENEYFPQETSISFKDGEINFISIENAIDIEKSKRSLTVRISEKRIIYIEGSEIVFFEDAKKWAELVDESKFDNVIVASQFMAEGITAYKEISRVFKGDLHYLDLANLSISQRIAGIEKNNSIELIRHETNDTENLNQITIFGARSYNTYIRRNSYLLSEISLLTWSDSDWALLKSKIDQNKPVKIFLSENISGGNDIISYVANKLNLSGKVFYDSPVGDMRLKKFLPFLWDYEDNKLTSSFKNSKKYISPAELYAKQEQNSNLSIICFSKNCKRQFPGIINGSMFIKTIDAENNGFYKIINHKLEFDLESLDRNMKYVLSPEDSSSLMISINMAKAMNELGINFEGFTYHYSNYYGSTFFGGSGFKSNELLYDSPPVDVFKKMMGFKEKANNSGIFSIKIEIALLIGALIAWMHICGRVGLIASFSMAFLVSIIITDTPSFWLKSLDEIVKPGMVGLIAGLLMTINMVYEKEREKNNASLLKLKNIGILIFIIVITSYFVSTMMIQEVIFYTEFLLCIVIGKLGHLLYKKLFREKSIGEKYRLTNKFTKNKGFICGYPDFKIPKAYKSTEGIWIVRSNHIDDLENSAAGIFESKVSTTSDMEKAISDLVKSESKKIAAENIQFWIQPYVVCVQRGVIESLARGLFFSIGHSYSKGNSTTVTEGTDKAEYRIIDRLSHNESDAIIFREINKIEKATNGPVIVEYGIGVDGCFHVFQVRKQVIDSSIELQAACDFILAPNDKIDFVETCSYTPLDRSLLYRLFGKNVLIDPHKAFRKKAKTSNFNENTILDVIASLEKRSDSGDRSILRKSGINTLISEYAEILSPLINMIASDVYANNTDVMKRFNNFVIKYFDGNGNYENNSRELLKLPFHFSLEKLRKVVEDSFKNQNIEMMSIDTLINFPELDMSDELKNHFYDTINELSLNKNEGSDGFVIYPGEVTSRFCGINESLALDSEEERKKYTLLVEYVPSNQMGLVKQHAAVVSLYGGPLSHLALTAKYYKIPCYIGSKHYIKYLNV